MDERPDLDERPRDDRFPEGSLASGDRPAGPTSSGVTHALAWIVILLGGALWIGLNTAPAPPAGTPDRLEADDATALFGKLMLGLRQVVEDLGAPFQNRDVLLQIDANIDQSTPSGRLASAAMRASFGSPGGALEDLAVFDDLYPPSEEDAVDEPMVDPEVAAAASEANERLAETVRTLVAALERRDAAGDGDDGEATPIGAAPVDDEARALLVERLGPIGHGLLASFDEPASEREIEGYTTAFVGIFAFLTIALLGGAVGLVMLLVLVMMLVGRVSRGEPGGLGAPSPTGSVYAETFAVWLLLFLGLQAVGGVIQASMMPPAGADGVPVPMVGPAGLAVSLAIFFASLVALAWPILRGLSWSQVRADVGLRLGNPFVEIPAGVLIWCSALPLVVVGALVYVLLQTIVTSVYGPTEGPSHPIQGLLGQGGVANVVLIFLIAAVAAPVVEEIMFRGVFYRYLRDVSRGVGAIASGLFAMLVSSFIFAAIHPQGLLFVPVLGALAIAFCFAREWRGSLLAAMTAHAINNALVLSLSLSLFA